MSSLVKKKFAFIKFCNWIYWCNIDNFFLFDNSFVKIESNFIRNREIYHTYCQNKGFHFLIVNEIEWFVKFSMLNVKIHSFFWINNSFV